MTMDAVHDVIVVGAGSAGCIIAARLSEDRDRQVLLLEAGPDYPTRSQLPLDLADGSCLPSDRDLGHDWELTGVVHDPHARTVRLPRGRVVGGSSAVNGTFAMRGFREDYDAWAAAGNPGWSFHDVLPTFRALEADLDFGDQPWHGPDGPVPIRRYRANEQSRLASCFLEAAVVVGHPAIDDHNEPGTTGAGPLPVNTLDRLRMSAAVTHLDPARERPNLVVRGHAPVDRIEVSGGRARGVRLATGEQILADHVILAAGAYASPAVLLRSGIGPADEVSGLGIDPVVDLPGVGRNLVDHPLLSIPVMIPREPAARPKYQTMVSWHSDGSEGPADLHLFACGPWDVNANGHQQMALVVALLDPASRGSVTLASPDPRTSPHVDLGYLAAGTDLDRMVHGVRRARQVLTTEPLRSLRAGPELAPGPDVVDDADLRGAVRQLVRTYHHPVGTCRMGPDPDHGAVVDADGRLHGIDGLSVIDASIMPALPRANTNLPTMMLAEHLAPRLAARVAHAA